MEYRLNDFRSNCVPKALHIVLAGRKTEHEVIVECMAQGFARKRGKGMYMYEWLRAARNLGLDLREVSIMTDALREERDRYYRGERTTRPDLTLAQFCREYRRGIYLVRVRGHLLVVNNGVVTDPNYYRRAARRGVVDAYEVLNSELRPNRPARIPRDPLITFLRGPGCHTRGQHAISYREAYTEWFNQGRKPIRLSHILNVTSYIRRGLMVDVREGNIKIEEE